MFFEPLVRKDFADIVKKLSTLPVQLSVTTNAILANRFIETFHQYGLTDINVSLDTLEADKFKMITRRNHFKKAYENMKLLIKEGFNVKINAVLMQDFNKDEIVDFVMLTKEFASYCPFY